jgi:beta-lactamase regulating signal transducer with metallopeptidase domain
MRVPTFREVASCLLWMWLGGLVFFVGRMVRDLLRLRTLRRSLTPSPSPAAVDLLREAARSVGLTQPPRLFESTAVPVPVVIGPVRPVVVLPAGMATTLDREKLTAVLLHEAAHVAHGDLWVGLLQHAVAAVFWWCPPVHRLNRRLAEAREEICDDYVVLAQGDGFQLAEVLVEMAAGLREKRQRLAIGTLGAIDEKPALEGRVERLVDLTRKAAPMTRMNRLAMAAAGAFGAAALAIVVATTIHAADELPAAEPQALTTDKEVNAVTFEATVRDSVSGDPVEGIVLRNRQHRDVEGTSDKDGRIVINGMMPGEFQFSVTAAGGDRKGAVAGNYARWWSPQAKHSREREEREGRLGLPPGIDEETAAQIRRDVGIDGFQRNLDGLTFDLSGDKVEVEVFVEPAATITGRVVDPDGKPVAGATVAPARTGSGNSLTGDTRYSCPTDEEGRFTMVLPAGKRFEYNLIAHDGAYKQWRSWANGASENLRTQPGERIDGLEIRLTRGGTVRGRVIDAAGKAKVDVEVRAAAVDRRDNRYYVPSTKTGQDGRFELRHVSPGEHHVQAAPFWLRADQAPKPSTAIVTVAADGTVEDVVLTGE